MTASQTETPLLVATNGIRVHAAADEIVPVGNGGVSAPAGPRASPFGPA